MPSDARAERRSEIRPEAQGTVLASDFYCRRVTVVAPELLGKVLVSRVAGELRSGRIVEVEAYDGEADAASHSAAGKTRRNATMFGPPGHLYVYFSYGMHWCANVVCEQEGYGAAVLIRALEPLVGLPQMRRVRTAAKRDRDLCSGPAKLAQALGLDRSSDGADLCDPKSPVQLLDVGAPPLKSSTSPRIGISKATARPWRWYVSGDPNVSRAPVSRHGRESAS